ncbi:2-phospho-L-lactate transferase CofD family protein [Blastococcus sp. TML/M2B]|uniref:2-phospho-L-lactate transferase CofD family protein n=1 Tax=Blastococcus sp. TML/M2B TaxID=2798727 RepID=UPI002815D86B|nr:2-phospho-L-lactate transferase CofD family protein [Blastococcus sp. TML/M2B]
MRAAVPEAEITAVVNTGDDVTMHGLRICPDLDTVVYTSRRGHRRGTRLGPGR